MAIGIYKPGQGYWVRILTAAIAGSIVLACGAWVWKQVLGIPLPIAAYDAPLMQVRGSVVDGTTVQLLGEAIDGAPAPSLGTATVTGVRPDLLRLDDLQLSADATSGQIKSIRVPGVTPTEQTFSAMVGGSVRGVPVIKPLYLQVAALTIVVLVGGGLIAWLVAVRRSSCEFLIATDGEMKKVNWSTRKEVLGSTWVVIVACILISSVLFVFDFGFQLIFRTIGVLETVAN